MELVVGAIVVLAVAAVGWYLWWGRGAAAAPDPAASARAAAEVGEVRRKAELTRACPHCGEVIAAGLDACPRCGRLY
ncbi:MAG: hypothetical protein A2X23_00145 [Chloroflexi bacterium GWC2_73_18]|nr:MAG: hypothetical protein A2X23_00145 [Chloroflexi bacterium GWC2_73_18]